MLTRFKPKSEFSRNVLTLMTGTTIAQAIPIAISPILTRIYTPEDFGVFALYMAIASIVTVIASGKYEMAILLPKKDEDSANIISLSIFISFFISFITLVIVSVFNNQITNLLGNPEISKLLYFIPLTVLLTGIYQSFNYWNNRQKKYSLMSKTTVLQSSLNAAGNVSFGINNFGFIGLIITNILTSFISVFYLIGHNKGYIQKYKFYINIDTMKRLMNQYKEFPTHTLPQSFIYQGTLQLPILAFKVIFSLTILGFYSLAYRVIVTPLSIVGNSLGQVFYQKAATLYEVDKNELFLYIRKMFFILLFISIFIGSIVTWFLPTLFAFVFGDEWQEAGTIAQYLMIYLIFDFALTPFTKIYLVSKNNVFYLKWEILRFIVLAFFFLYLYVNEINNLNMVFLIFSIINLLLYIILSVPILNKNSFIWRN